MGSSGLCSICKPCRNNTNSQRSFPRRSSGVKACGACQETQGVRQFHSNKQAPDGLASMCKRCAIQKARMWCESNSERTRKSQRMSYLRNRPARLIAAKKWAGKHPERVREIRRRWDRAHPEVVNANTRQHRARKRGVPGFHTAEDIRRLYVEQRKRCYYCGKLLRGRYHVDHKIPLARTELNPTNWPDNLALACGICNRSKGSMTVEEFIGYRTRRGLNVRSSLHSTWRTA